MKRLIQINVIFFSLWLVGFVLERLTGITQLRSLATLALYFFLPGYNVSFLLFPRILASLERSILALSSSFIGTTLAVYAVSSALKTGISQTALPVLFACCAVSLGLGMVGLWRYGSPFKKQSRDRYGLLACALAIYCAILVAIFVIYPFIPESDPYLYVRLAGQALVSEVLLVPLSRPLFTVLAASLSSAGSLSLYDEFKFVIPFASCLTILPLYALIRERTKNRFLILGLTLLPATIPVVMLEGVVSRPQAVLMAVFPAMLYLMGRALAYRSAWLAAYVLALSLVLVKFHELSIVLVLIALLTLAVLVWPEVKKEPKLSIAFAVLVLLALQPHLGPSGPVAMATGIARIVAARLIPFHPRAWFLSGYTNIDGIEVGWPGFSWIFYYGYNLGFALPALIILVTALMWRKKRGRFDLEQLPAIAAVALFFCIAEVLPRLNVPFLPDRAWSFMVLALCLLFPYAAHRLEVLVNRRVTQVLGTAILLASIGTGLFITYAKQGWITRNEYKVATFIKDAIPDDAVIVGQPGSGQIVEYYGERILLARNVFMRDLSSAQIAEELKHLDAERLNEQESILKEKKTFLTRLNEEFQLSEDASENEVQASHIGRQELYSQLGEIENRLDANQKEALPKGGSVYVLYSTDKFSSLYGSRSWWRNLNYAGADLTPFSDTNYFTKVYSAGGVEMWKLN